MKGLKTVAANLAGRMNQQHHLEVELAKVYEAGLKQGREGAYTIAPLVWYWEYGVCKAHALSVIIHIRIEEDTELPFIITIGKIFKRCKTMKEAKAYCQQHHEAELSKFLLPL